MESLSQLDVAGLLLGKVIWYAMSFYDKDQQGTHQHHSTWRCRTSTIQARGSMSAEYRITDRG